MKVGRQPFSDWKRFFNGSRAYRTAMAVLCLGGLATLVASLIQLAPTGNKNSAGPLAMSTLTDVGQALCADIGRTVAPAMDRTRKLAENADVIASLRAGDPARMTEACNKAITQSTEIDAIAMFDSNGRIQAINTVYSDNRRIPTERVARILGMNFDGREIIQRCVRNDAAGSILEFQTTCDITPAFFDSTGLSIAYSVPVQDPSTGKKIGVVSSRLKFNRLSDLLENRVICGVKGSAQFVTDKGQYFSEAINGGREKPPVETSVLAGLVSPLSQGKLDYSFTQHAGRYLCLFRLSGFTTVESGGIQVLLIAPAEWVIRETRQASLLRAGGLVTAGLVQLTLAGLFRGLMSYRKLQANTADTAQRLDMALDAGGLGSWDWDIRTNVISYDRRFAEQLGLEPISGSVKAEEWLLRLHPDDSSTAQRAAQEHLAGHTLSYCNEHRVRHADGSWRWIMDCGKIVAWDDNGVPLRMVGTHTDITARKSAATMLAQAQKLESVGQLASGIAHEINTPAQYVSDNTRFLSEGFGGLLRLVEETERFIDAPVEERTSADRVRAVQQLRQEVDLAFLKAEIPKALDQSIDGLESISKIVRAMKEFSHPGGEFKEQADLNAAIESTAMVCRNRWKYVAELSLDLDPALPAVPVLLGEFNQVILNLIVNAADAIAGMDSPGPEIKGRINVSTQVAGTFVEIQVADNGPGIPESTRRRIFEPFFTTKPVGKGTGQGLALSRNVIVTKHGGELNFESNAGGGTRFIVRLPLTESKPLLREAA